MKIELLKKYAFVVKAKPKGTIAEVTKELGEKLIKKKIAKKYNGKTPDDELAERTAKSYKELDES